MALWYSFLLAIQIIPTICANPRDFSSSAMPTHVPGVNDECLKHILAYRERVNHLFLTPGGDDFWALEMADASGNIPSGLLQGNLFSIGSYYQCMNLEVDDPVLLETLETLDSFRGRYVQGRLVTTNMSGESRDMMSRNVIITLPPYPLDFRYLLSVNARLGVCIPSSCTKEEFQSVANENLDTFDFLGKGIRFDALYSDSKADVERLEALDVLFICTASILGVAIAVGTILQVLITQPNKGFPMWQQFFLGFSLKTNIGKLFDASEPKSADVITCLNGMRFMSMTWVLLSHSYTLYKAHYPLSNSFHVTSLVDDFLLQVVWNGYPSVDTFFFLSGCLASYLTFKELDKTKGHVNWIMFYLHRYLRLTGPYAIILLFRVSLYHFCAVGAIQNVEEQIEDCKEVMWRQLLYINNFNQLSDQGFKYPYCDGPSWYLAVDMQMFIVVPLIVYPMWRWKKWAFDFIWPSLWLLISTLVLIILTDKKDWPAAPMLDVNPASDYGIHNYWMPWTRFQPYGVGIMMGYILHLQKGHSVKVHPLLVAAGWATATATGLAVIYGLNFPHVLKTFEMKSKTENIFYGSFHRMAWGCALAWLVWACVKGYGGIVNNFLSWEAFFPLSRLCYIMYLIHDMVIYVLPAFQTFTIAFSHLHVVFSILWDFTVTIGLAIPIVLIVEMPLAHLEKFLLVDLLRARKSPVKPNDV